MYIFKRIWDRTVVLCLARFVFIANFHVYEEYLRLLMVNNIYQQNLKKYLKLHAAECTDLKFHTYALCNPH